MIIIINPTAVVLDSFHGQAARYGPLFAYSFFVATRILWDGRDPNKPDNSNNSN